MPLSLFEKAQLHVEIEHYPVRRFQDLINIEPLRYGGPDKLYYLQRFRNLSIMKRRSPERYYRIYQRIMEDPDRPTATAIPYVAFGEPIDAKVSIQLVPEGCVGPDSISDYIFEQRYGPPSEDDDDPPSEDDNGPSSEDEDDNGPPSEDDDSEDEDDDGPPPLAPRLLPDVAGGSDDDSDSFIDGYGYD